MSGQRVAALFLAVALIAGCKPQEVAVTPEKTIEPDAPAVEAVTEKTTLLGQDAVRLTSMVDDFSITLPPNMRGCILTENEINRFSDTLAKASPTLGSQVRYQANQLRPKGGVAFGLNVLPSDVTDGFADLMNLAIRGFEKDITIDEVRTSLERDLKNLSPKAKLESSILDEGGRKAVYVLVKGMEGPPKKEIDVTRVLYATIRGRQVFTATYACSSKRAGKVLGQFKASAMSLKFN